MTTRLLIPVDGSAGSLKAVEYVAETFGRAPDMEFVLLHILPKLPPSMWDDGHILTEPEQQERKTAIEEWKEQESKPWETMISEAKEKLLQGGVKAETLTVKYEPTYSDVADDILDEAELERCNTIVMGRHGIGPRKLLMGSVSKKVVDYAKGIAVTVVDHGELEEPPETRILQIKERRLLQAKVREKKAREKKAREKEEKKAREKQVKKKKADEPVVPLLKRLVNYLKNR